MFTILTLVLLLTDAVLSDGFIFPDQVLSKADSESWVGDDDGGRDYLNSYSDRVTDQGSHRPFSERHRPAFNEHYNGNKGGFVPGGPDQVPKCKKEFYHYRSSHRSKHSSTHIRKNRFGDHYRYNNRGNRESRPYFGGIVNSHSEANAQSSGFGSQTNAQSGSQFFNGGSQSNAQSHAQSQGYNQAYPFGPNYGGSGASSASSAASATSGIVDGVATASAAAAAASASSGGGGGGGSVSSSSSSSSSSSGNNGGFVNGQSQLPSWFFRTRAADEDAGDKLVFSEK